MSILKLGRLSSAFVVAKKWISSQCVYYHEKDENPKNVGSLDKKDKQVSTGIVGAPACGDVMKSKMKEMEKEIIGLRSTNLVLEQQICKLEQMVNEQISKRDEMVPWSRYESQCRRCEEMVAKINRLEKDIEERTKPLLILKVRSRIEELERMFLPGKKRSHRYTREDKWGYILNAPIDEMRTPDELKKFRNMITVNADTFINTLCALYGNFSDRAAHKTYFTIRYDRDGIIQMFEDVGMHWDTAQINTVYIILSPIP